MRSATKRKLVALDPPSAAPRRAAPTRSNPKPRLDAVPAAKAVPLPPARKTKRKIFHASVQVTRVEEWFVEAETAEEARRLLESGHGQRSQIGECLHFEIDNWLD